MNKHALAVALAVAAVFLSSASRADEDDDYVITSCDPKNGIATVRMAPFSDPPSNALLLSDIHSRTLCDLGNKRTITIDGLTNPEHENNNRIQVRIAGNVIETVNGAVDVTITATQKHTIDLAECVPLKDCTLPKGHENPWFNCESAKPLPWTEDYERF
jgi:hypothetical protein